MNENINLCEILKNCPKGTKFYSYIYGEVEFIGIDSSNADYPIHIKTFLDDGTTDEDSLTKEGRYSIVYKNCKCILVPSFEQPDWSKWECPKPKFDPKTLQPFDKVLAASMADGRWVCDFFSHIGESIRDGHQLYVGVGFGAFDKIIPYNDKTKHLVGTKDEAPKFYKYWED